MESDGLEALAAIATKETDAIRVPIPSTNAKRNTVPSTSTLDEATSSSSPEGLVTPQASTMASSSSGTTVANLFAANSIIDDIQRAQHQQQLQNSALTAMIAAANSSTQPNNVSLPNLALLAAIQQLPQARAAAPFSAPQQGQASLGLSQQSNPFSLYMTQLQALQSQKHACIVQPNAQVLLSSIPDTKRVSLGGIGTQPTNSNGTYDGFVS
jgi:hypothetical protein